MNPRVNLKGKTFGLLKVIRQTGQNKWKNSIWLCKCKCGGEKEVLYQRLTQGHTKSCGCLRNKKVK